MGSIDPVFAVAAAVTVGGGLLVVTQRNPIYCAISMLASFLGLAVIYLRLAAPFLAAIHVLVYTGAILVLFLFVIMLLNLTPKEIGEEHSRPAKILAGVVCGALFLFLAAGFFKSSADGAPFKDLEAVQVTVGKQEMRISADDWGGVRHVGAELFKNFIVPFEIVSVLIVVAILGAVVLAKRKL